MYPSYAVRINFWVKSWVKLKKVLSLSSIYFEYTVIQRYKLFIYHNISLIQDSFMESNYVKFYEYKNKFFYKEKEYLFKNKIKINLVKEKTYKNSFL